MDDEAVLCRIDDIVYELNVAPEDVRAVSERILGEMKKEVGTLLGSYEKVLSAAFDVYYGAYWVGDRVIEGDRPGNDVWSRLRDACGFDAGKTMDILGVSFFPLLLLERWNHFDWSGE